MHSPGHRHPTRSFVPSCQGLSSVGFYSVTVRTFLKSALDSSGVWLTAKVRAWESNRILTRVQHDTSALSPVRDRKLISSLVMFLKALCRPTGLQVHSHSNVWKTKTRMALEDGACYHFSTFCTSAGVRLGVKDKDPPSPIHP